jgi:hypothetical protein
MGVGMIGTTEVSMTLWWVPLSYQHPHSLTRGQDWKHTQPWVFHLKLVKILVYNKLFRSLVLLFLCKLLQEGEN